MALKIQSQHCKRESSIRHDSQQRTWGVGFSFAATGRGTLRRENTRELAHAGRQLLKKAAPVCLTPQTLQRVKFRLACLPMPNLERWNRQSPDVGNPGPCCIGEPQVSWALPYTDKLL